MKVRPLHLIAPGLSAAVAMLLLSGCKPDPLVNTFPDASVTKSSKNPRSQTSEAEMRNEFGGEGKPKSRAAAPPGAEADTAADAATAVGEIKQEGSKPEPLAVPDPKVIE